MKTVEEIDEMVRELPPDLQQQVADFIEFLLQKRAKKAQGKPSFGWAGALKDIGDERTSVELQHDISAWMAEED